MRYQQIILLSLLLMTSVIQGKIVVNVGINTIQPPLIIDDSNKVGLTYDVIALINTIQDKYLLKTKMYPVRRLLIDYQTNDVHVIAFNNTNWGWKERGGKGGLTLIEGRDLFFSLNDNRVLDGKELTIGAVHGFHYAFAKLDQDELLNMKNVTVTDNEDGVLKLVLNKRVDKGIVSESYLNWLAISKPELFKRIEIDYDNPDNSYIRQFVTLPNSPISIEELNHFVEELLKDGSLQSVYKKYGMTFPQ